MSVVSKIASNYTVLHKALIFLMRLAWKSRIRLPYLLMAVFMVCNARIRLVIVVDIDGPQLPD